MTKFAHLLIVDDDVRICRLLSRYLEQEGYRVDTAADGPAMWALLKKFTPDLIVLDLMLPGVDGITLARKLRAKTNIGIIMLTGKSDPVDTVVGLEVGADDYITKPFDNRELLARIRSVLRRLPDWEILTADDDKDHDGRLVKFNGWEMNLDAYELISPAGEIVHLSDHEFRLLSILVRNSRHVLSRDKILQNLSRRDWLPEDRSVDVSIAKLRKVIEENPAQPKLIRTIRSVGYQFTGKVEIANK
jgi:DNA-binding response OmpR family regulator